jgi:diguanylate cyclase (GGDEF)-like protein
LLIQILSAIWGFCVTFQIWRNFLLPVGVLVTLFVALLGYALSNTVRETNAIETENTRKSIALAIEGQLNQMALLADDNALWDDAARAIYLRNDRNFLWETWGAPTLNGKNYDRIAVVDQSGKTLVAFAQGREVFDDIAQEIGASLPILSRKTDHQKQGQASLVRTPRGLALMGVANIVPISRNLEHLVPKAGPFRIIFFKPLSNDLIASLGESSLIADLGPTTASAEGARLALKDASGKAVGTLGWTPRASGFKAIERVLPLLIAGLIAHLALAFFLILQGIGAVRKLGQQALIDSLSELPNRRGLKRKLETRLKNGDQVALAMMDLDGFKGVNDNHGHQVGDRLIKEVASLLKSLVGPQVGLARLGGDEFALLFCGLDAATEIEAAASRIIARFAQPFRIDERTVSVGISIGLASGGINGIHSGELMRRADVAMYAAKRAGKMRINWYDELLDQLQAKAHGIETELRTAMDRNEFSLVYQPIFAGDGLTVRAVEALLRWTSQTRGEVPTSDFIPVAEESGLIDRIGLWVLRQACEDGLNWPHFQVTVNISPAQLRNPDFAVRLSEILEETGFPAHRLELEITERYLVIDPAGAQHVLDDIRQLGVNVVLDDYGSGFASVGFLRKFAFGKMKIDRHLVKDSETSEAARAVLQASVTVARALNMVVVAGGIETPAQADLMRVVGCNELQGWHFSEAVSAVEIDQRQGEVVKSNGGRPRLRLA